MLLWIRTFPGNLFRRDRFAHDDHVFVWGMIMYSSSRVVLNIRVYKVLLTRYSTNEKGTNNVECVLRNKAKGSVRDVSGQESRARLHRERNGCFVGRKRAPLAQMADRAGVLTALGAAGGVRADAAGEADSHHGKCGHRHLHAGHGRAYVVRRNMLCTSMGTRNS